MMYAFLRGVLFRVDPELSHDLSLSLWRRVYPLFGAVNPDVAPRTVMGLRFPNPIGLAAGLDKNGVCVDAFGRLGFGFIEVGTVTPRPQAGNPKPRLFRAPAQSAIVNRMGFNNLGVDALVRAVQHRTYAGVLGINLGKNKDTPLDRAADDYQLGLQAAYSVGDYFTINVSSPNTAGLRQLQKSDELPKLLRQILRCRDNLADDFGVKKPIVVKLAPDLNMDDIPHTAGMLREVGIDGVILTNTTIDKTALDNTPLAGIDGGLSGAPLKQKALAIQRAFRKALGDDFPIVGVGGLMTPEDVLERLQAGADLVQLYSGLIFEGPGLVKRCLAAL